MPSPAIPILPQLVENGESRKARFWSMVERRGPNECWPWLRCVNRKGYGRFYAGRRSVPAHRFAWVITHGVDPDPSEVVMHCCDNPPCCNPAHLSRGTNLDNVRDMCAKGRARFGGNGAGGSSHPVRRADDRRSKLTADQVLRIAADARDPAVIGAEYGVHSKTIQNILEGISWGYVTGIPAVRVRRYRSKASLTPPQG